MTKCHAVVGTQLCLPCSLLLCDGFSAEFFDCLLAVQTCDQQIKLNHTGDARLLSVVCCCIRQLPLNQFHQQLWLAGRIWQFGI